jgi:hypothetical protein
MMMDVDDAKRLILCERALADEVNRQESDPPIGAPSLLACTKVLTSYPTTAQCFFACEPLTLLGPEVEGGSGVVSTLDATFLALNLGSAIPPIGTQVVSIFVGNRWVFRYDS